MAKLIKPQHEIIEDFINPQRPFTYLENHHGRPKPRTRRHTTLKNCTSLPQNYAGMCNVCGYPVQKIRIHADDPEGTLPVCHKCGSTRGGRIIPFYLRPWPIIPELLRPRFLEFYCVSCDRFYRSAKIFAALCDHDHHNYFSSFAGRTACRVCCRELSLSLTERIAALSLNPQSPDYYASSREIVIDSIHPPPVTPENTIDQRFWIN